MPAPLSAELRPILGGDAGCHRAPRRSRASHIMFAASVSIVLVSVVASAWSTPDNVKESVDDVVMELDTATPTKLCKETYGIFPCSNSLPGALFLTLVYGSILTYAAQCIGDGGEAWLDQGVLPPALIGGIVLPVLGAIPDAAIIFVSTIGSGSKAAAERKVSVGVGTLAGSTIMLLTIAYSGSLWLGRCDLDAGGAAIDRVLDGKVYNKYKYKDSIFNFARHAFTTGITHDDGVLRVKWFMVATSCVYLIAQIPAWMFHDHALTQKACLAGAIACGALLVIYLLDSAFSNTDDEEAHLEKIKVKVEMRRDDILSAVARFAAEDGKSAESRRMSQQVLAQFTDARDGSDKLAAGGRRVSGVELVDPASGVVNRDAIARIFDVFDVDGSGYLDELETEKFIKVVFMSSGEHEVPADVINEITSAQSSTTEPSKDDCGCVPAKTTEKLISRDAFLSHIASLMEAQMQKMLDADPEDPEVGIQEEEEDDDDDGSGMSVMEASMTILFGTLLATLFSDALVDTIDQVGRFSGIPNFVIGFVVCPLASNASELISSLQLASRKKMRNCSVTFAQIYAACTMNNCMVLGVFFFMVWYKELDWNYGAEVSSILLVTWIMAFITLCETTLKTVMVVIALLLYPLSLVFVEGMHRVGIA